MSNQGETYQRISVPDAAKLLGISAATVRRRIRDGSLQAERVHRPQGITYVVLVGSNRSNQDDRSKSNHEEKSRHVSSNQGRRRPPTRWCR